MLPRPGAAAPSQALPDWYEIGGLIEAPGKKSGGLCCRFRTKRDQNGPGGGAGAGAKYAGSCRSSEYVRARAGGDRIYCGMYLYP